MCLGVSGRSITSLVVLAVIIALCDGLSAVTTLLLLCESCIGLSSGGMVGDLLSRCGDTLDPVSWTEGSPVAGMSTRYLVSLLLNAT